MTRIKTILILIIFAVVNYSCSCEDCDPVDVPYTYLNASAYELELTVEIPNEIIYLEATNIQPGDSAVIVYSMPELEDVVYTERLSVSIGFLSDPEKCVVYSGEILDLDDDPRSNLSTFRHHAYAIDDSLYLKAGSCIE